MNKYAARLKQQWLEANPTFVQELENPDQYFRQMGEQVQEQVLALKLALAGKDSPDEPYLQKMGRLNAATMQAEQIVLQDFQPPSDAPETERPQQWEQMNLSEREAWAKATYANDPEALRVALQDVRYEWKDEELERQRLADLEELQRDLRAEDED